MTRSSPSTRRCGTKAAASPSTLFDRQLLSEVQATVGPARLAQLLNLLAAELDAKPRSIREALADCDHPRAAHEAHSLKGAAACLGAQAVASAAREIEQALGKQARRPPRNLGPALRRMAGVIGATQLALLDLSQTAASLAPFA